MATAVPVAAPAPAKARRRAAGNKIRSFVTPEGIAQARQVIEDKALALVDEVAHDTGDVLDRHGRVDAVLVEQVDVVGPEPP